MVYFIALNCLEGSSTSFHRVGGQLIPIPDGPEGNEFPYISFVVLSW